MKKLECEEKKSHRMIYPVSFKKYSIFFYKVTKQAELNDI